MIKIALNALDMEENIFRPITFRFRQLSQFVSHTTCTTTTALKMQNLYTNLYLLAS